MSDIVHCRYHSVKVPDSCVDVKFRLRKNRERTLKCRRNRYRTGKRVGKIRSNTNVVESRAQWATLRRILCIIRYNRKLYNFTIHNRDISCENHVHCTRRTRAVRNCPRLSSERCPHVKFPLKTIENTGLQRDKSIGNRPVLVVRFPSQPFCLHVSKLNTADRSFLKFSHRFKFRTRFSYTSGTRSKIIDPGTSLQKGTDDHNVKL